MPGDGAASALKLVVNGETRGVFRIGLAGVKALFVAAFFQQLKDEPKSLSLLLLMGLVIAMALMIVSLLQLHPVHV